MAQLFKWSAPIGYVNGDKSKPVMSSVEFFRALGTAERDINGSGGAEVDVTVGSSPYTYTATVDGYLLMRDGTVTRVDYIRSGTASQIGALSGMFPILAGDGLKVTYTSIPTITFIPR